MAEAVTKAADLQPANAATETAAKTIVHKTLAAETEPKPQPAPIAAAGPTTVEPKPAAITPKPKTLAAQVAPVDIIHALEKKAEAALQEGNVELHSLLQGFAGAMSVLHGKILAAEEALGAELHKILSDIEKEL
jgi:hypothetical protein